jgi:hypothetical protein
MQYKYVRVKNPIRQVKRKQLVDTENHESEEMVQREVGRCTIWKALWTTTGRKARNAILQTIKACKQKNTCDCWGAIPFKKESTNFGKEKTWTTSREAEKGKSQS